MSKSTGDPNCPPHVRNAQRIAKLIMARAAAASLGQIEDDILMGEHNLATQGTNQRSLLGA